MNFSIRKLIDCMRLYVFYMNMYGFKVLLLKKFSAQFTLVLPDVFNVKMRHTLNCSRIYVHHIHQMPFCYCTLFQWYVLCTSKHFLKSNLIFHMICPKVPFLGKQVKGIYRFHQIPKGLYLRHYKRLDSIVNCDPCTYEVTMMKADERLRVPELFFQTELQKFLG